MNPLKTENDDQPRKKSRNTNYCSAPQCSQYLDTGISLHRFPSDAKMKAKWEVALRMRKPASATMRLCSRYFLPTDYFPSGNVKRKLYPHVVPTQNLPQRTHDAPESSTKKGQRLARQQRTEARRQKTSTPLTSAEAEPEQALVEPEGTDGNDIDELRRNDDSCELMLDVGVQASLADFRQIRPKDSYGIADILANSSVSEKCTQLNLLPLWEGKVPSSITTKITLPDLLNNKENLFTFTGIHSLCLLETLVSCVKDLVVEKPLNKKMLSLRDRVILTMVKIKQNMSFSAIGVLFGINRQTCSNYFRNMCSIIARVLRVAIPWPDQEMIRCNLPKSFKNYKHTRIILDCAETEIEKCKCLKCRIMTYSQYKKYHSGKFDVGVTPSGLITEISVPFGGRASDKKIVKESGILDKLDFRDGVMTDKGFAITKECEERHLHLIRPPFLRKQQQMSREDSLKNAEIARARVHVERVIQRLRQYEFLRGPIPWPLAPYFEDILVIAAGLTNLGPPVINVDKFM